MREEIIYCMATHPQMPNRSGHARGRVVHQAKDKNLTVCNMKVDRVLKLKSDSDKMVIEYRRKCKICFPA